MLHSLPDFSHCLCYPQSNGALWCWFPSGWACAHSRPLWVSPTTSPVRLGVSPAAASTPTGVFNQRFEALFPCTGALGCAVCFAPLPLVPVYLCTNVGPQRSATGSTACPVLRHSESGPLGLSVRECAAVGPTACPVHPTLPQSAVTQVLSTPVPISAPPTGLDECFFYFLSPWLSDFLAIRFSVSSGCARRRSMSTYAAILVLLYKEFSTTKTNNPILQNGQKTFFKGDIQSITY